jgi:hypothetical protein
MRTAEVVTVVALVMLGSPWQGQGPASQAAEEVTRLLGAHRAD